MGKKKEGHDHFTCSQIGTFMHTYSLTKITSKKKTYTGGTRAIKGEKNKMMYASVLCYQDKNICDKDSGLCTH